MTIAWNVPGLPFTLSPSSEAAWTIAEAPGTVTAAAAPRSDIFIDPGADTQLNAESMLNAATLLGAPPDGDFQFSARVAVEFASTYDAGVLVLYRDESCWAKLCFERSPAGQPTVVSVVNRRVSDDCNHFTVAGNEVWFRIVRGGDCFAFHASTDGALWQLVRYFAFDDPAGISVGFEAQSPTGEGCRVEFGEIRYEVGPVADLRAGG